MLSNISVKSSCGESLHSWPFDEDIPDIDTIVITKKGETNIVGPIMWQQANQLEMKIYSQVNANLILINQNISKLWSAFKFLF